MKLKKKIFLRVEPSRFQDLLDRLSTDVCLVLLGFVAMFTCFSKSPSKKIASLMFKMRGGGVNGSFDNVQKSCNAMITWDNFPCTTLCAFCYLFFLGKWNAKLQTPLEIIATNSKCWALNLDFLLAKNSRKNRNQYRRQKKK